MKISLFGTRKPKQFEYKPLYWNPEKEEREERQRLAKLLDPDTDMEEEGYVPGSILRASRARRMERSRNVQTSSKTAIIRLVIFFILVGIVIIYLSDLFVKMV